MFVPKFVFQGNWKKITKHIAKLYCLKLISKPIVGEH